MLLLEPAVSGMHDGRLLEPGNGMMGNGGMMEGYGTGNGMMGNGGIMEGYGTGNGMMG